MDRLTELVTLVQQGDNQEAVECADLLLADSYTVEQIIFALSEGLSVLKNKCTVENFQLIDVLLAGRAMVEVVDECVARKLQETMDEAAIAYEQSSTIEPSATLVIGTIQGDSHDLGKHIVATLSRYADMNVVNLGKNVPVESFVKAAIDESADFVGVSCLMTASLHKIGEIKPTLLTKGYSNIKVVGGGAALSFSSAEALKLDYIATDVFEGLDYFAKQNKHSGNKPGGEKKGDLLPFPLNKRGGAGGR